MSVVTISREVVPQSCRAEVESLAVAVPNVRQVVNSSRCSAEYSILTFLRRRRVERSPLLFDFGVPALGAFHLTFFMFRNGQDDREFLTAG